MILLISTNTVTYKELGSNLKVQYLRLNNNEFIKQ